MPRTNLPPTPAPSTDIAGQECSPLSATEESFNLPPPAIASKMSNKPPHSAANPHFSLPPPPTRSRTIIQMKPKPQHSQCLAKASLQQMSKGANKKTSAATTNASARKPPSSTSAAGKKIARKTAHSVIERRRRSKMNEEFGVLKSMIPACTDQEMHKLSILQASIDYLRYLENCITDLKTANQKLSTPLVQPQAPPRRPDGWGLENVQTEEEDNDDEDGEDPDEPMEDPRPIDGKPSFSVFRSDATAYISPQSITPSPSFEPAIHSDSDRRRPSVSALPSPAFGSQQVRPGSHHSSYSIHSASLSPSLIPCKEQDEEATAALLMLNKDRRNPKSSRGMSVKDLLSC